jgi:transposase
MNGMLIMVAKLPSMETVPTYGTAPLLGVAVLGASNFTYAEATWTQGLADWIGAHTRAIEAIGGVPRLIVPDNAKTAVIKACLYEPAVNRTYTEMAAHYDTAILPTRPRKPRDKAKSLPLRRWAAAA